MCVDKPDFIRKYISDKNKKGKTINDRINQFDKVEDKTVRKALANHYYDYLWREKYSPVDMKEIVEEADAYFSDTITWKLKDVKMSLLEKRVYLLIHTFAEMINFYRLIYESGNLYNFKSSKTTLNDLQNIVILATELIITINNCYQACFAQCNYNGFEKKSIVALMSGHKVPFTETINEPVIPINWPSTPAAYCFGFVGISTLEALKKFNDKFYRTIVNEAVGILDDITVIDVKIPEIMHLFQAIFNKLPTIVNEKLDKNLFEEENSRLDSALLYECNEAIKAQVLSKDFEYCVINYSFEINAYPDKIVNSIHEKVLVMNNILIATSTASLIARYLFLNPKKQASEIAFALEKENPDKSFTDDSVRKSISRNLLKIGFRNLNNTEGYIPPNDLTYDKESNSVTEKNDNC